MKYYSEVLNKNFDSEKACLKAEEDYKNNQYQQKASRKLYADKIAVAEGKIADAKKFQNEAKTKIEAIQREALLEIADIKDEVNQKLADAYDEYNKALKEFTDKFGTYTKTYTGKDAENYIRNTYGDLNTLLDAFVSHLY